MPSKSAQLLLENIIATTAAPSALINNMAFQLIHIEISPDAHVENKVIARFLLSLIQQRYPSSLQKAIATFHEDDESSKENLDQLLISLSTVKSNCFLQDIGLIR